MRTKCLLDLVGGIEVFVDLDNRNFLLLKIKQLDKIHYIPKNFPNFSLCHLTWINLSPGDNNFSMLSLAKIISPQFSSISPRAGKRLLSPQSHVIIHINYPGYLWFLSPLTFSTLNEAYFHSRLPPYFLLFALPNFTSDLKWLYISIMNSYY